VNCPDVEAEHRSYKMTLGKGLMFAQQEAVKIAIPLRKISPQKVWCHRCFVYLPLMCSTGAIKELDVSSHSTARVFLFLGIRSRADTVA